jgi:hypothetical protein
MPFEARQQEVPAAQQRDDDDQIKEIDGRPKVSRGSAKFESAHVWWSKIAGREKFALIKINARANEVNQTTVEKPAG